MIFVNSVGDYDHFLVSTDTKDGASAVLVEIKGTEMVVYQGKMEKGSFVVTTTLLPK